MKWSRLDTVLLLVLCGYVLSTGHTVMSVSHTPEEDAAILMRYSRHVAEGHGIVWNVGEAPVDGATDFLYMLVLAAAAFLGFGLLPAAQVLNIVAHAGTVALVYLAARRPHRTGKATAFLGASYLAVGPAFFFIAVGFGAPLFALAASGAWYLALQLMEPEAPDVRWKAVAFAGVSLITGLIRPEGVFLAGFMLAAIVLARRARGVRFILGAFVAIFAVVGGAYFFWRWNYFGHPLPLPYYKKGGGQLYPESLRESFRIVLGMILLFLPAIPFGYRTREGSLRATALLLPSVAFTVIWVLMSSAQNIHGRFQYAVLPLFLMAVPGLLGDALDRGLASLEVQGTRRAALLTLLAGSWLFMSSRYFGFEHSMIADRRYKSYVDVGLLLNEYAGHDYTLAVTEAGLMPFYSQWRTLDVWGLNDPWIVKNGRVNAEYLDRYKPHVVMFEEIINDEPEWKAMVGNLKDYVRKHGYRLAGAFAFEPYNVQFYYVRRDFPHSEELARRLGELHYVQDCACTSCGSPDEGDIWRNYAQQPELLRSSSDTQ